MKKEKESFSHSQSIASSPTYIHSKCDALSMSEPVKPLITLSNIIGPTDNIICEKSSFLCNGLTVQCWVYYNPNVVQKPPIVVIHGGPGFSHNYLLPLKLLAEFGYPVVFYDQAGCGDSTFVADPDTDAPWLLTIEYYVKELAALVHHFQLYEYYLYGSSWGTVIAQVKYRHATYPVPHPSPGIRRVHHHKYRRHAQRPSWSYTRRRIF